MAEGYRFYSPRSTVDWTSDQAYQQFRLWRKEVERIVNGPMNGETDTVKLNTVFIWAGAHAERLVEAKMSEDVNLRVTNVDQLLTCLDQCLTHSTFFREAREDFYNIKQEPGENTTAFHSRIMELYKLADFPANTNFLIVDKLIHSCLNSECKRKLMAKKKDATVKNCLDLMRSYEAVEMTMKKFEDSCKVNASYSRDPTRQSQKNGSKTKKKYQTNQHSETSKPCTWCGGGSHARDKCPAQNAKCAFCNKRGHYEKACIFKKTLSEKSSKQKPRKEVNVVEHSSSDSEEEPNGAHSYDMDVISVSSINHTAREVLANVKLHTAQPAVLLGKVDTGAMATCMPVSMLADIGLSVKDLTASRVRLHGVTGADMKTHGELCVPATCNGKTHNVRIMVTELGNELILGLDFCNRFQLVDLADVCIQRKLTVDQDIEAVHITHESDVNYEHLQQKWKKHTPLGKATGDALQDLKNIFPDMFDGTVGLFEGEVELKVAPDAQPVQLPPRAVALSVLPKLKAELDKMENEGIIRPCPETTDWVHNLVIVSKKNGDIRLCLDPKNLNKHLIRSVHYTASWEDALHSLQNGEYFSTLDAKSGYWTKKLSKDSQLLTAFNTPFKKYCFVRLPFGLSVSSEIFSEQMDQALAGVPGTFPCADDVKVQGSTEVRHDINLLETVEKARRAGIKFNPEKCQIKKNKISYFGRVISSKGVEPCPKKVKAMQQLMPPTTKQELQSFMGSINFMATFIPNLAKKTNLMRNLLKKDAHFIWTKDMQVEFEAVKTAIANTVALSHFNPSKPAIIETDASLKGLGAVLIQEGKPIRFLSKSLTQTEADYSNIERELLAILFACERLHQYTFGRMVTIHTDHKPLESVFKKPISLSPTRLQRMLLRLRTYDLNVKYVGSKSVLLADTLSRLVRPGADATLPGLDVNIAHVLQIKPTRLQTLRDETKADATLTKLTKLILSGWPEHKHDLAEDLHPYWCFRDELAVLDGLVMKGSRVIVPAALRSETLNKLHDGHQGLTATLQRARRTVYWPKLQDDISEVIQKCQECQRHAKKKPVTSEKQISTVRPMETIGMDIMAHKGEHVLVAIDYFSGYITVDHLHRETSEAVIERVSDNCRKFGLPEKIITDNGPCFRSQKFDSFCEKLEIQHLTSSPHFHQSNGRAERAIQTIEQIYKKCQTKEEITLALLAYHDTPVSSDLPSPSELFFNRKINTRLGLMYQPTTLSDKQKMKLHDKRAAHLTPSEPQKAYIPNQQVWFTEDGNPEWRPGFIESRDLHPDSYWIISADNYRRLRRNKHDIKPCLPAITMQLPPANPQSTDTFPHRPPDTQEESSLPQTPRLAVSLPTEPDQTDHAEPPPSPQKKECNANAQPSAVAQSPLKPRSSHRRPKPRRDPDFVYN